MIKIEIDNLVLIITDTCPTEFSECAIRCLNKQRPKAMAEWVDEWVDDEPKMHIPRFSKFIGQLGRIR